MHFLWFVPGVAHGTWLRQMPQQRQDQELAQTASGDRDFARRSMIDQYPFIYRIFFY